MRRRELNYTEIALLELLRGSWEPVVEGGWAALVAATADACGRTLYERIDPVALSESATLRSTWPTRGDDIDAA
jgi:hypothetical protein